GAIVQGELEAAPREFEGDGTADTSAGSGDEDTLRPGSFGEHASDAIVPVDADRLRLGKPRASTRCGHASRPAVRDGEHARPAREDPDRSVLRAVSRGGARARPGRGPARSRRA